jgi:hypothetical protein
MSFSHLIDEEEDERLQETRQIAQKQFVQLSEAHVKLSETLARTTEELNRYKLAYRSASTRAGELSTLLEEER